MRSTFKLLLAMAFAVTALAASTSLAGAAAFTVDPAGPITSESLGRMSFADSTFGLGPKCFVFMEGELHEGPIEKVPGALIGVVNEVEVEGCIDGTASIIEASLPWHISYESIAGTLPSAVTEARILLEGTRFLISTTVLGSTIECEYEGNALGILDLNGSNPYTTGLIISDNAWDIGLINAALNDGITCPDEGVLRGTLELDPTQTLVRS